MLREKVNKGVVMKPNIVVLFSDQQRWDTLGCYGQKLPISPNLDNMAAEGVRFEHAFTCQPVCGPYARRCRRENTPRRSGVRSTTATCL
jgi:arylsulfatase A-like enzyme